MKTLYVALSVVVIMSTFNVVHAQNYTPESLLITLFSDGKAYVEYRLNTDVTVPTITVPLFGTVYEQLIVVDEDNLIIDSRVQNNNLVVDTLGASSIFITYTTPDLVNKTGRLWTFMLDAPVDTSIRLPSDSVIIGLNQIPNSIRLSENQYILIMPRNSIEISYVIGAIGTREHATVAISEAERTINEHRGRGIVVTAAENKLMEARSAFETGRYADAEILANDARTIANNASRNASLASTALTEAEAAIRESNDQGFDVSNAQQLFNQAGQEYANGNYEVALNLAQQARTAAIDARSVVSPEIPSDFTFIIAAVIGASAAGAAGAVIYMRSKKKIAMERPSPVVAAEPVVKERRVIDLNKIFTEKPYLRDDDKETISYIAEKGGEAFESEIRERFNLPKTTVWRLVKRLEREDLVEVKKAGGQNLIRIKQEFTRPDQDSAPN